MAEDDERSSKEKKPWDVFYSSTDEASSASETTTEQWQQAYRILKVLTIIICFAVVLTAGIVTKGATFFIVSQISGEPLEYCDSNDATRTSQINPTGKVAWVWALFFSYSMPEVLTFLTSLRTITMRTSSTPAVLEFLICLGFEVVHAVGVTILFFFALPGMDSIRGIMATNALCIIPAILKLFIKQDIKIGKFRVPDIACKVLTVLSLLLQISALIIWPIVSQTKIEYSWALPVGLFLTSFGWWEAFVDEKAFSASSKLWLVKTKMCDGGARAFTYTIIAPIKIGVMFLGMILYISISKIFTLRKNHLSNNA